MVDFQILFEQQKRGPDNTRVRFVTRGGGDGGWGNHPGRSHMGFQLLRSRAVFLAIGMLAGCTGRIVSGSSGSGGAVGVGTGGTGDPGSGGTTGGGGDGRASVLNLNGSPQYFRFVRLT